MKKVCANCGREGSRGFWVQIRQFPAENRVLCSDYVACSQRAKKKAGKSIIRKHRMP